jgi:hypothetical protein
MLVLTPQYSYRVRAYGSPREDRLLWHEFELLGGEVWYRLKRTRRDCGESFHSSNALARRVMRTNEDLRLFVPRANRLSTNRNRQSSIRLAVETAGRVCRGRSSTARVSQCTLCLSYGGRLIVFAIAGEKVCTLNVLFVAEPVSRETSRYSR